MLDQVFVKLLWFCFALACFLPEISKQWPYQNALQDFIGHIARITRRSSPVTNALRALQRYLCRVQKVWTEG